MAEKKVLSNKQMPTKLPLWSTLITYLMLDKFDAPGYVWGILGTIFVLSWIGCIYNMTIETETEIKL